MSTRKELSLLRKLHEQDLKQEQSSKFVKDIEHVYCKVCHAKMGSKKNVAKAKSGHRCSGQCKANRLHPEHCAAGDQAGRFHEDIRIANELAVVQAAQQRLQSEQKKVWCPR
jgi:hypothetical protein